MREGRANGVEFALIGYAWKTTFSDFLQRMNPITRVRIESDVKLEMKSEISNIDLSDSKMTDKIVLDSVSSQKVRINSMVPVWIIILAAIGGLLILVIIVVILWKMGFFRRGDARYAPEMHRAHTKVSILQGCH